MKNFYNDEKLGIKNEDAPNATEGAVAGAGDDNSVVVVKKKKKNPCTMVVPETRNFLKGMETLSKERI